MGAFTIAYVPTVEEVLKVKQVDTVRTVEEVKNVQKLPHPYFPLKKLNYQKGGRLHIEPEINTYQAVYIPECDLELKGIHLCLTSYNVEDTYDVMIGSRYIIKGSYVKEMAEYRMLEVYEVVNAGTPIIINFHNYSGLEKYLLYEIITLVDQEIIFDNNTLDWNFYWEGINYILGPNDYLNLVIPQPNYVNIDSIIHEFALSIINLRDTNLITTITYKNDTLNTDYVETDPAYIEYGFLARVNVIAVDSIEKYQKSILITFKNISTIDNHPVEIGIRGNITNISV